jgi:hypothetical protein
MSMKLWKVEMQLHIFFYFVSGKEFQILIQKSVGTSKTGVAAVEKRKLFFFFFFFLQELHPFLEEEKNWMMIQSRRCEQIYSEYEI